MKFHLDGPYRRPRRGPRVMRPVTLLLIAILGLLIGAAIWGFTFFALITPE